MIELDIRYSGEGSEGKASYITLHNKTFDICVPEYKRGVTQTLDYSSIKHVYPADNNLVLKILRTEVIVRNLSAEDAKGLAQVIEIGRKHPIISAPEFKKYRKAAQREEERADRRKARVEKFSALVDSINRFQENSRAEQQRKREEELEEERREEEKNNRDKERIERIESRIDSQTITSEDQEEEISLKLSRLNKSFQKYLDNNERDLLKRVMQTFEDNVEFLEDHFPNDKLTVKASERLEELKAQIKAHDKASRKEALIGLCLFVLFFVVYYLLEHFGVI
ncbi:MAG: hypothetical protein K2J15_02980 [Muribaculaceae bacterium]|nr:hypothetical protein [Muribaculaceae bacterium]